MIKQNLRQIIYSKKITDYDEQASLPYRYTFLIINDLQTIRNKTKRQKIINVLEGKYAFPQTNWDDLLELGSGSIDEIAEQRSKTLKSKLYYDFFSVLSNKGKITYDEQRKIYDYRKATPDKRVKKFREDENLIHNPKIPEKFIEDYIWNKIIKEFTQDK